MKFASFLLVAALFTAGPVFALAVVEKTSFGQVAVSAVTDEGEKDGTIEVSNKEGKIIARAHFDIQAGLKTKRVSVAEDVYVRAHHTPEGVQWKRLAGKGTKPRGLYVVVTHHYTRGEDPTESATGYMFLVGTKSGTIWHSSGIIK